ncbi:Vitamin B6 transporter TPN1 [Cytospora mali]|uniref:Vitamin B6 transporter TPN1 n=1 Tax=Cytospora mali TaxID=578113 RepID=A0A194VPU1_CYTMA|nr:Vitamin B6 transporter TPN1 [Valsa mali]
MAAEAAANLPLGWFGQFCAVVLALCVASNNISGTYVAALNFQMFDHWLAKVPRPISFTVAIIIFIVCAIAGRTHLFSILLNLLSLIGYWVIIWIVITLKERGVSVSEGKDLRLRSMGR